jgi:hypothetical protein
MLAGIDQTTDTNMITCFDAGDLFPDTYNTADNLMARHHRINTVTPFIADLMQIQVTYATVEDLDNHIVNALIPELRRSATMM